MFRKTKITAFFLLAAFSMSYPVQNNLIESKMSLICMNIDDYRAYLKNHPPLDRLYRMDNDCYFLVNHTEMKQIKRTDFPIRKHPLPLYDFDIQQGGVNGAFHNYQETEALLFELESQYPDMAQVFSIGQSIEGRELYVIKISDHVTVNEAEPNIFIVGAHHAREWISVEVPLLFARYILEQYSNNPEVQRAVNGAQIYILPIQNPDGLEFSIHTFRMWRKNRRYNGNLSWGVDPNRNYGYKWGYDDIGSSPNPDDYTYRGASAFSEPECAAVRDFLLSHPPAGSLTFHNYSQTIVYPWGYTEEPAPDEEELNEIAKGISKRIFQVSGRMYTYGLSSTLMYPTNGDTDDWVYGTFGAPAFTIELPPVYFVLGGFILPEGDIDLCVREFRPAILYFINYFITELD